MTHADQSPLAILEAYSPKNIDDLLRELDEREAGTHCAPHIYAHERQVVRAYIELLRAATRGPSVDTFGPLLPPPDATCIQYERLVGKHAIRLQFDDGTEATVEWLCDHSCNEEWNGGPGLLKKAQARISELEAERNQALERAEKAEARTVAKSLAICEGLEPSVVETVAYLITRAEASEARIAELETKLAEAEDQLKDSKDWIERSVSVLVQSAQALMLVADQEHTR